MDFSTALSPFATYNLVQFLFIYLLLVKLLCHVPVTVVWCWPYSKDCLIKMPLVSFHNQLMSSADQVNVICSIKLNMSKNSQLVVNYGKHTWHIQTKLNTCFGISNYQYPNFYYMYILESWVTKQLYDNQIKCLLHSICYK